MWSNDIELKSEKYLYLFWDFHDFAKCRGYENEGIGKCRDENAGNGIPEIKPQGWLPSVIIFLFTKSHDDDKFSLFFWILMTKFVKWYRLPKKLRPMELVVIFSTNINEKFREMKLDNIKNDDKWDLDLVLPLLVAIFLVTDSRIFSSIFKKTMKILKTLALFEVV